MSRFPTKESEIYSLALKMVAGLKDRTVFPTPPAVWPFLNFISRIYNFRNIAEVQAIAQLENANKEKNTAFKALATAMKHDIRYAENTVNFDDNKLKLIGWSGHAKGHSLALPGQPLELKADIDESFNIALSWKKPADGGQVSYYQVQSRARPNGDWTDIASGFDTYLFLKERTRNCEIEYIVYAVNKAGQSIPSNIAEVKAIKLVLSNF